MKLQLTATLKNGKRLTGLQIPCTNTAKVIWRFSSFTGGGRPRMPLRALFQARAGTRKKQLTFRKLAG